MWRGGRVKFTTGEGAEVSEKSELENWSLRRLTWRGRYFINSLGALEVKEILMKLKEKCIRLETPGRDRVPVRGEGRKWVSGVKRG